VAAAVMFAAPLATAAHAAGAAAASGHATAPTASRPATGRSCRPTVTQLPDLGHGGGAVSFSGGTIVGEVTDARGSSHPAIWRRGHLHVIQTPAIRNGGANYINARGQIVGFADNYTKAWELYRSRITILPDVPGSHADYARRINNRGQIVGAAGNLALTRTLAARWDSASAAPVLLRPQPGDAFSFSKGINDRGWVAGDTDEADGTPHAAVWSPAGHIHVFAGAYGPRSPGALFEINDAGTSAGESAQVSGLADEATIWSRSGVPAGLGFFLGLNQSTAFGLSGTGYVSGESSLFDYAHGAFLAVHAFVWPGHGPLLTLPVPHLLYARSVSAVHQIGDNGTVVGAAGPVNGVVHAYVWTCAFQQAFVPSRPPRSHRARQPHPSRGSGPPALPAGRHSATATCSPVTAQSDDRSPGLRRVVPCHRRSPGRPPDGRALIFTDAASGPDV
jgi:uncharacterized membrane protein